MAQELKNSNIQVIAGLYPFIWCWGRLENNWSGGLILPPPGEGSFQNAATHSPFPLHLATSWMVGTIRRRFLVYRRQCIPRSVPFVSGCSPQSTTEKAVNGATLLVYTKGLWWTPTNTRSPRTNSKFQHHQIIHPYTFIHFLQTPILAHQKDSLLFDKDDD